MAIFITSYCNHAHDTTDGKPVDHNCYVLPPRALEAERDGDNEKAIELLLAASPMREHRGKRVKKHV